MPQREHTSKVPNPEEFRKTVEEAEEKYGITDCLYRQCIEEFSRLDISQLNEAHQVRIIEPFLLTWGRMTRVLGYLGVEAICQKLRALDASIEPLRSKSFLSEDFDSLKKPIVELYDDIRKTSFRNAKGDLKQVGPVAASKILHLACPDLFIMWDTNIRNRGYKKYYGDGEEYHEFLVEMRSIWKALENTISDLQVRHGNKVTRILDQYNWMKFTEKRS